MTKRDKDTPDPVDRSKPKPSRFGGMAGTVTIMPGVDLTEPTESWDAEDRPDDVIACLKSR